MPFKSIPLSEARAVALDLLSQVKGPTLYEEQESKISMVQAELATAQGMFEEQVSKTTAALLRAERAEQERDKLREWVQRELNACPFCQGEPFCDRHEDAREALTP